MLGHLRGHRRVLPSLALLVGAPFLAACDPPPPPPVFTVDSDASGGDADPGDGACDDGTGACTVLAAVDEANALGRAEIVLPVGTSVADLDVEITGALTIRGEASDDLAGVELPSAVLRVRAGATLALSGVDLQYGGVLVQGGLIADRIAFGALTVQTGSAAVVRNAFGLATFGGPLIENDGLLHLQSSTLLTVDGTASGAGAAIAAGPGSVTRLRGTLLVSEDRPACTGTAPISDGYNASSDATCGLTATGDLPSLEVSSLNTYPDHDSPLRDAVPFGEAGCGTEVVHDILGNPRPAGNDPEPACDIGAWEAPA